MSLPSTASAGYDSWSCLSTLGTYCSSPFQHHSTGIHAYYYGRGNLPLFAGSWCVEAACSGTWIFWTNTGQYGYYNHVYACYSTCHTNAPYLGNAKVMNLHTSRHTVWGYDEF